MVKTIAYTNQIPGNESTDVYAVSKLPAPEKMLFDKLVELRKGRLALEQQLKEVQGDIDTLSHTCKHHYFNDAPGRPFDNRTCYICLKDMGSL